MEAGVHFGHQVRRWNPKMSKFIFGAREGIHVINLENTVEKLLEACEFVNKVGQANGTMIFLASKKQAKAIVMEEAKRCGAMYMVERWVGGLLTNWETTSKNVKKLTDLKTKKEAGEFSELTKKENLMIDREIAKLTRYYGGVEGMTKLPDAIFVVDVKKEENACREAKKKKIPVVAIADTNTDLFLVDYPIPGNDDAIKAIQIITEAIASAFMEGKQVFEKKDAKEKVELAGRLAKEVAKEEKEKEKAAKAANEAEAKKPNAN